MRLYTVIGNDLYLKQVVFNDAINASITASDFPRDSFNTEANYYLERFLFYKNRENWNGHAIYCFTAPSAFNLDNLNDDEVVITFEVNDKDVMLLDYDKFLDYTYKVDKVENNMVKSNVIAEMLKKYFSNVEQYVANIENFFDAVAFVNEIPCNYIRNAIVIRGNKIVSKLQANKDKMFRRIPMQYLGKGNGRVRELLKHKPQNIIIDGKKNLTSAEK